MNAYSAKINTNADVNSVKPLHPLLTTGVGGADDGPEMMRRFFTGKN